jgi:hypothetical protein
MGTYVYLLLEKHLAGGSTLEHDLNDIVHAILPVFGTGLDTSLLNVHQQTHIIWNQRN